MTQPDPTPYARLLGARLRVVRSQLGLSLDQVQRKSGGEWKAVVVGSYERAARAISVVRLAALADFYGVAVAYLLPQVQISGGPSRDQVDEAAQLVRRAADLLTGPAEPR